MKIIIEIKDAKFNDEGAVRSLKKEIKKTCESIVESYRQRGLIEGEKDAAAEAV